jgi:HAD superfamily hydrolase (TIGR01509 family)
LRALIFDMDGVLADTERLSEQASIRVFREMYNTEVKAEDFHPFIGTGAYRYVEGVAEQYGVTIDSEAAVEARFQFFLELLEEGAEDISFPGAHALLKRVGEHPDWTLALATSSPAKTADATLRAARIDAGIFSVSMNGDLVTHRKPHPEIYLITLEKLGLPASQCVVVEDAITGIAASKAAGIATLAVTHSFGADKLAQADHIVNALDEVTFDLLETLLVKG